jgi:hypothetical protein
VCVCVLCMRGHKDTGEANMCLCVRVCVYVCVCVCV